jgi:LuxR family transcriptional regulator of spore coat protein
MESILTKREKEIFKLLIKNYSILEISKILNISDKTVRNHISNVIQKLDVNDRCQAIVLLLKLEEIHL